MAVESAAAERRSETSACTVTPSKSVGIDAKSTQRLSSNHLNGLAVASPVGVGERTALPHKIIQEAQASGSTAEHLVQHAIPFPVDASPTLHVLRPRSSLD